MTEAAIENHPIDALTQRRVDHIVEVFNTLDIDAIVALFSEDVVVTYADRPLLRGREALRAFIAPRYADLVDYRLSKRIRMEQGVWVGIEGEAQYRLASEGADGSRYRTRLFEFLQFRDDLISRWDYVGNTSPVPAAR
ncbi:nuclear transport factor 2 family protein [Ralstonia pseudosolanacearum]|uniref:nuclear transport factor 2 family protein n=1 Tax=Ralstonia pseudosolanacearum TaxID=1310165 RepID=UPI0007D79C6F|nr:nuclear transport factor 2 family protein [Ralstonia pseudosolanacearum]KAF3458902.1 nuclear transport factor 2 family protein [Ralstonia solanacearum]MCF1441782.1 nuclear transport factor 2 family protein [Ralstonia solanacearum]MDC6292913.1 nuclear transport factor 2 family protein [Ralstonia pseudosolanacearum]MDD7790647.1 nuclear transport factor 2 family protein [Ralstonia pseudosolanacearum]MDN3366437.1 nuclear transport factor 2 family protein [Ralstonia pseudosolanacearum]